MVKLFALIYTDLNSSIVKTAHTLLIISLENFCKYFFETNMSLLCKKDININIQCIKRLFTKTQDYSPVKLIFPTMLLINYVQL